MIPFFRIALLESFKLARPKVSQTGLILDLSQSNFIPRSGAAQAWLKTIFSKSKQAPVQLSVTTDAGYMIFENPTKDS